LNAIRLCSVAAILCGGGGVQAASLTDVFRNKFLSGLQLGPIGPALASTVASTYPVASASSSVTFAYDPELGTFERRTGVPGPIMAERAETIGWRQINLGMSYSYVRLTSINGDDLGNLENRTEIDGRVVSKKGTFHLRDGRLTTFLPVLVLLDLDVDAQIVTPGITYGITPDIACYSKGLTGGSLPLAVTLCRHEIFQAHYATDRRRTFFHSSSFTANPIACAAALANLRVWETEPVRERVATLAAFQAKHLQRFRDDTRFQNVRQTGTITAMDLKTSDAGYLSKLGPKLQSHFRDARVLLRPLGNTIYVLPPYCVTNEELAAVYDSIEAAAGIV